MIRELCSYVLILICTCMSFSVFSQHRLGPKVGYIDWEKRSVNINGTDIGYKMGSYPPAGVSYGYTFFNRLFVGGEFIFQDLDLTAGDYSSRNDIDVYRYNALMNYYFTNDELFRPYIGIGLGYVGMEVHAAYASQDTKLQGYVSMGNVGLDMQFSHLIGLNLEYRRAYMSVDDPGNNQLKTHNNEFFIGLIFTFGK